MSLTSINLQALLRARVPGVSRFVPRWMVRSLERLIHQDELNSLLESNEGREGADFCNGVLHDLGVTYKLHNADNLPGSTDRRVTFVCNHPLGGLDGICLIDMLASHYGQQVSVVVNDLLSVVSPLKSVFVPINKHGQQSRGGATAVNEAFTGDGPVLVFPAGLVSRKQPGGNIKDLKWNKMVVNKSVAHGRDIIPLFFDATNSSFFYNFAKFRTKIGLRFNYEMILLPGEVFKKRNAMFDIYVGKRISVNSLKAGAEADGQAQALRDIVYRLSPQ